MADEKKFSVLDAMNSLDDDDEHATINHDKPTPVPEKEVIATASNLNPLLQRMQKESDDIAYHAQDDIALKETPLKNDNEYQAEKIVASKNVIADETNEFRDRVIASKKRLGLKEGSFVDRVVKDPDTGETHIIPAERVKQEFVFRFVAMNDDEIDDYFRENFREMNIPTNDPIRKLVPVNTPSVSEEKKDVPIPTSEEFVKSNDNYIAENITPVKEESSILPSEVQTNIEILIDKTGVGDSSIVFTAEERDKLQKANTIKLNVIEEVPVYANRVQVNSIKELKLIAQQVKSNNFPITLAASRYKCDMSALSYPELEEVTTIEEIATLSKDIKVWSIIYAHLCNPSIGEFKDFDDFLDKTAFVDKNTFIFGMLCATVGKTETVSITCNHRVWDRSPNVQKNLILGTEIGSFYFSDPSEDERIQAQKNDVRLDTIYDELAKRLTGAGVDKLQRGNYYTVIGRNKNIRRFILSDVDNKIFELYQTQRTCGTEYDHYYSPSSLLSWDKFSPDVITELTKTVSAASFDEVIKNYNNGPLVKKFITTLPYSETQIVIGVRSAKQVLTKYYQYLIPNEAHYKIMELAYNAIKEKASETTFDRKYTKVLLDDGAIFDPHLADEESIEILEEYIAEYFKVAAITNLILSGIIDRISIPIGDTIYDIEDPDVIFAEINALKEEDHIVLWKIYERFFASYDASFSYKKCKCPVCHEEYDIPIKDMESLVFPLTRSRQNLNVDVSSLLRI
jgi:uncharacterized protein (DUF779 family)